MQAGSRAVLTDHDGHFRFIGLSEAVSTLQVTKPGFALSPEQLENPTLALAAFPDKSSIDALLYPEAIITGTVTAPDGTPLPHIAVAVHRILFSEAGPSIVSMAHAMTDSQGNFRAPVPAGQYLVQSEFTRFPYDPDQVLLPSPVSLSTPNEATGLHVHPGEEVHLDLSPALSPTHRLSLASLPNEDGPPPRILARSSAGYILPLSGGGGRNRRPGQTGLDLPSGSFVLEAVVPTAAGDYVGQTSVTVTDHDLLGVALHFALVPSIPIEITLHTAETSDAQAATLTPPSAQQLGLSLQSTQIELDPAVSFAVRPMMLADHTAAFRAAPGRYHLEATSGSAWFVESATYGGSNLLQQEMIVGPSVGATPLRIVVSNQTGSLNGSVKLSGVPAACWVSLVTSDPSVAPVLLQHSTADGTFSFAHLPPGNYRAIAFEHKHSADLLDPNVIAAFASHMQSIAVQAGEPSSVSLTAVPTRDLLR